VLAPARIRQAGEAEAKKSEGAGFGNLGDDFRDRQRVGPRIEREPQVRAGRLDAEGDVWAIKNAAGAVVLIPRLVDGGLRLIVARRDSGDEVLVDAVGVDVLKPRSQAIRLPVTGAGDFALETARRGDDPEVDVVGDPLRLVVEVELDGGGNGKAERNVGAVELRVLPVVLRPTVVQRNLVLPVTNGQSEGALPDVIGSVVVQVGGGACRIPVACTAQFTLQAADECDGARRGERRGGL
jgi:hypothetical protein